jgi:hypothetical protein
MAGGEKLTKEATEAEWDSEVSHQRVEHGWEGKRSGEEVRDVRLCGSDNVLPTSPEAVENDRDGISH